MSSFSSPTTPAAREHGRTGTLDESADRRLVGRTAEMTARPTLIARALRLLLWLMFAHAAIPAVALGETYRGLLVPDNREAPIPITVDLQQSSGRFSGRVTTLAPLSADGRIVSGKRQRSMCDFESDLGFGQ